MYTVLLSAGIAFILSFFVFRRSIPNFFLRAFTAAMLGFIGAFGGLILACVLGSGQPFREHVTTVPLQPLAFHNFPPGTYVAEFYSQGTLRHRYYHGANGVESTTDLGERLVVMTEQRPDGVMEVHSFRSVNQSAWRFPDYKRPRYVLRVPIGSVYRQLGDLPFSRI